MTTHGFSAAMDAIEQQLDEAEKLGSVPCWSSKHQVSVEINGYAYALLAALTDRINAASGKAFTIEEVAAQAILRELRKVRL